MARSGSGTKNPYGGIARYYHLLFDDWEGMVESEGRRLADLIGPNETHSVVDVTCGTGLQSIGLALRGFEVTGYDNCPEMLKQARRNASSAGVHAKFIQADILKLPQALSGRFDAAISCGNSLSHMRTKKDLRHAFSVMHLLLRPRGCCVIDAWDYDGMKKGRPAGVYNRTVEVGGRKVILYDTREYHGDIVSTQFNLLRETGNGWRSSQFSMDLRMWKASELVQALCDAGFGGIDTRTTGECVAFICRKL